MKLLTTLLEISEVEKLGRQLVIALDRIAPGKLMHREGGAGWKAVAEDDDDNFIWINGNQVLVQTPESEPGNEFIRQVMSTIKNMDAMKNIEPQGRLNDTIKGSDGERIPIRVIQIGDKRYMRMDVRVHPKT